MIAKAPWPFSQRVDRSGACTLTRATFVPMKPEDLGRAVAQNIRRLRRNLRKAGEIVARRT